MPRAWRPSTGCWSTSPCPRWASGSPCSASWPATSATRPDAASHPLGHLWDQLNGPHRDRPALLALYRRIKNGPDGEPAGDQSCSVLQVLDALVQYRNGVFGHGAGRFEAFYDREMGPLLFPAANELLAEGLLDLLGPRGSRLVYLDRAAHARRGHASRSGCASWWACRASALPR